MAEFSIKISNVENTIEVLAHYAVQLNDIKQEVASVKSNLTRMGSASYHIYSVLSNIDRGVLEEALSMRSLSSALERISDYYRSTEGTIVSASAQSTAETMTADASSVAADAAKIIESTIRAFRDILVSLGIVKAEKQIRTPGQEVTEAQQREMDRYMRNEIEEILKKDRYSEKVWKDADLEERKAILNEYLQEVAAVMGLTVAPIKPTYSKMKDGYYNLGGYSPDTDRISINTWVLQNSGQNGVVDSFYLMKTIVHELRHKYQHDACANPDQFVVTEETIQSWQESIDNYKSRIEFETENGMEPEEAFDAYQNQTIEIDARWFAGQ